MTVGGREQQAPAVTAEPAGRGGVTYAKWAAVVVAAVAVLFFCYWRQSLSAPLSSDGSGNVLQAWAMLHGNLLLHNWWVSDVSFYTTELPQYMLIEVFAGLGPWVVHIGAAMTYTLLVLLAAVLAKGRTGGREGLGRALLAGGIMLAPQLNATSILLLSPDHTGTTVPLLVIWLLIDRSAAGSRARWYVSVLVGLGFFWTMVGDSVVLLTGIIPLVAVCLLRVGVGVLRKTGAPSRWYEVSLAGAAVVAGVAGTFAPKLIAAVGGFQQWPVGSDTDLGQLQHGSWVTLQAFLELFGANIASTANYGANPALEVIFVALHLAGAAAVVCAVVPAFRRFFRPGELLAPVFAAAVVVNLAAYMISTHAQDLLGAREIAGVLPLGAVLAGRILGGPLALAVRPPARSATGAATAAVTKPTTGRAARMRRRGRGGLLAALTVLSAGYLASLGYGAAQAPVPASNEPLAAWLTAHRLTDGLAGYWQANSTTLETGRRVLVAAVTYDAAGTLAPYQWETDDTDYDPALHYANFVVAGGPEGLPGMAGIAEHTFGKPARTYRADGYTIMVWHKNLLAQRLTQHG
jgi:hypothetical protein